MRGEANFGERGDGKIHWRVFLGCSQPGRSYANLVHRNARYRSQRLVHTPHTGAAVHAIDSQGKFRHLSFLSIFV